MDEKRFEVKRLVNDFVKYSMRFLSLGTLEGFREERDKMLGDFVIRFKKIFNNFKKDEDFEIFYKMYEEASKSEKRALIEFLGHMKDKRFIPFLLDIAKSGNFHSIDSIISLGQIADPKIIEDLEEIANGADNVVENVTKSVIYTIKKKNDLL